VDMHWVLLGWLTDIHGIGKRDILLVGGFKHVLCSIIYSGQIITTSRLMRGITPKWPYFRLVNYCNLPRYGTIFPIDELIFLQDG
jgi:hypothetical protein